MKTLSHILAMILLGALLGTPVVVLAAPMAPTAVTIAPSAVTEKSATFSARVNGGEVRDTIAWFEWGLANDPAHYFETPRREVGGSIREISVTEDGMAPDRTYFVRAVVENTHGKDRGYDVYFTTKSLPRTGDGVVLVTTYDAAHVSETKATLRGYVAPHGTDRARVWFAWGETTSLGRTTSSMGVNVSKEFSADLNNLKPGTVYYVRAIGEGGSVRTEGALKWFLTPGVASSGGGESVAVPRPSSGGEVLGVSTETKSVVTGRVVPDEKRATVYVYYRLGKGVSGPLFVDYGTTRSLGQTKNIRTAWGSGDTSVLVGALTPCTEYFYRAAVTIAGEDYVGGIKSFTTQGCLTASSGTAGGAVKGASSYDGKNASVEKTKEEQLPGGNGVPRWNIGWVPPPIFGLASPGSKATATASAVAEKQDGTGVNYGSARVDSSGGVSGFLDRFFGGAPREALVVTVETASGEGGAHQPVEYQVVYTYRGAAPLSNTALKVIFPKDVVYIGDDTANEFYLEDQGGGPERTYLLPIGTLAPGTARTITMMGITTADADGVPAARARIEFTDASGVSQVVASSEGRAPETQIAATGGGEGLSILPSSLLGWVMYLVATIAVIVGVRMGRAYYEKRKKEIEEEQGDIEEFARAVPAPVALLTDENGARDEKTGMTPELFAVLPR